MTLQPDERIVSVELINTTLGILADHLDTLESAADYESDPEVFTHFKEQIDDTSQVISQLGTLANPNQK